MQIGDFFNSLQNNGIDFFCGVPDSLLKSFCAYAADNCDDAKNIICANEGNAVGVAAGYYLSSQKPALIYMQNSGLGNIVNPMLSLMDEDVYNIPSLLLIGWRGELGLKDEPQHKKQGKLTLPILDTLDIPYEVISDNIKDAEASISRACKYMAESKKAYALVVKKGVFDDYKLSSKRKDNSSLAREEAIKTIIENITEDSIVVSTTGMISRELFECREFKNQGHAKDFLTVGSMGHASSIALGVAINKPQQNVICLDGDGSLLMHMGALAVISSLSLNNFKHIILNNEAHDSVGGQPTVASHIDFCLLAKSCGYNYVKSVNNKDDLKTEIKNIMNIEGTCFLEIKVKKGNRADLGRPTKTPIENKQDFMEFLHG